MCYFQTKWNFISSPRGPKHISEISPGFRATDRLMLPPLPHRLPVPGHWVRPPWQPPGLPAKEPSARDGPRVCHRQQHCLHTVLPAASPFCSRCGPGYGLPEPKTGLFWEPCFEHLSSKIFSDISLDFFFPVHLSSLIPSQTLPNFILFVNILSRYIEVHVPC